MDALQQPRAAADGGPSLAQLVDRARALADRGARAVLGVTGPPGAGKTTLADAVATELRRPTATAGSTVARVPMDGFHLADVELVRLGRRDRKGAPDTFDAAGYVALLHRVLEEGARDGRGGGVVYAPAFERDLDQPLAGAIPVPPTARLVITEGNYLLCGEGDWARVRPLLAEVWYVDLAEDERLRRLVRRHGLTGKSPQEARAWSLGSDQRNADLVAATRARADLLVGARAVDEAAAALTALTAG